MANVSVYIARFGQSIFDVCLQTYGSLDYLYKLIRENDIDNINQTDLKGRAFTFDSSLIEDISLFNQNEDENIRYVTSESVIPSENGGLVYVNVELEEDGSLSGEEDGSVSLRE
jgi:hypothetical protein